jgi:hypothetical protein
VDRQLTNTILNGSGKRWLRFWIRVEGMDGSMEASKYALI